MSERIQYISHSNVAGLLVDGNHRIDTWKPNFGLSPVTITPGTPLEAYAGIDPPDGWRVFLSPSIGTVLIEAAVSLYRLEAER